MGFLMQVQFTKFFTTFSTICALITSYSMVISLMNVIKATLERNVWWQESHFMKNFVEMSLQIWLSFKHFITSNAVEVASFLAKSDQLNGIFLYILWIKWLHFLLCPNSTNNSPQVKILFKTVAWEMEILEFWKFHAWKSFILF